MVTRRLATLLLSSALLTGGVVGVAPGTATATDADVVVTGRIMYEDADGILRPVRFAKVEVCDYDGIWPFDCDRGTHPDTAQGRSDSDGRFDLVFTGGDLEGLPDIYVRAFSATPAGNVTIETGVALFEYCMATSPHNDYDPADGPFPFDVGDISPNNTVPCNFLGDFADVDQEHAAWQQLEFLNEVHAVADDLIGPMPDVSILWPSELNGVPFYLPGGQIRMVPDHEDNRLTLYHEYGHHVLYSYAESPIPDYDNDVCDESNPLRDLPLFGGHCFWEEEHGSIHWTEGFPNFWAEVVRETNFPGSDPMPFGVDTDGDGDSDENVTSETPYLADGTSPTPDGQSNELIEGWTHVILRDLWDGDVDNHDAATDATGVSENDSADRAQFDFDDLWEVIQTDPAPDDIWHNHPTTLLEFREMLVALHPGHENRINAVFTENGIFQFGADLGVSDVTASKSTVVRGEWLTVGDETFNDSDAPVGTGESSRTGYSLEPAFGPAIEIGSRAVGALDPGESDAGTRYLQIPTSASPRTYTLVACADSQHKIYESRSPGQGPSMVDNCADGPTITVANQEPIADAGGPYEFDEGAGGLLDASASTDPDGDALTFSWSDDDGILTAPFNVATVGLHSSVDDGTYSVSVDVSDDYGASDADDAVVVVSNVAPVVDGGEDVAVDEGATVSRTVTVADPVDTSFEATVDWGEGDGLVSLGTVTSSFEISHLFDDDAAVTVAVCVNDGDDTDCDSFDVGVSNVAPSLDDDSVTVTGIEGTSLGAAAAFADPGEDTWSAGITWGDTSSDTLAPLAGRSVPLGHVYAQDGPYAGEVCVLDDDLGGDCSDLAATIANAPPDVGAVDVAEPVMALVETSFSADFTDLGVLDEHIATVDWGDGAGQEPAGVIEPSGAAPGVALGGHTYAAEGDYTVTVCVTDDDDTTCVPRPLDVMSVAEAAEHTIDALVARGSTDPAVVAAIGALDGTIAHASSGALDKMLARDWVAAVSKLGEAVSALDIALTDESATQDVLTLIAEAIARQRLAEVEARGFTSSGARKQVTAIRNNISAGRALYLDESYRAAIDKYRSAVQAAVDLLRKR